MAGIIPFILNRVIQKYMDKRLKAVVNVKQAKKMKFSTCQQCDSDV